MIPGAAVDQWIAEVHVGVRAFWRGGDHANTPARLALPLLNRLIRILRYIYVILAVHLPPLAPTRVRAGAARTRPRAILRKPAFPTFARYRVVLDGAPARPQPAALARSVRDPWLASRRKLDVIARALSDPMPIVRRLARRLPRRLVVFSWKPPRRPPPLARRDFFEVLEDAWREARFQFSEWRRRTRDNATEAPGS